MLPPTRSRSASSRAGPSRFFGALEDVVRRPAQVEVARTAGHLALHHHPLLLRDRSSGCRASTSSWPPPSGHGPSAAPPRAGCQERRGVGLGRGQPLLADEGDHLAQQVESASARVMPRLLLPGVQAGQPGWPGIQASATPIRPGRPAPEAGGRHSFRRPAFHASRTLPRRRPGPSSGRGIPGPAPAPPFAGKQRQGDQLRGDLPWRGRVQHRQIESRPRPGNHRLGERLGLAARQVLLPPGQVEAADGARADFCEQRGHFTHGREPSRHLQGSRSICSRGGRSAAGWPPVRRPGAGTAGAAGPRPAGRRAAGEAPATPGGTGSPQTWAHRHVADPDGQHPQGRLGLIPGGAGRPPRSAGRCAGPRPSPPRTLDVPPPFQPLRVQGQARSRLPSARAATASALRRHPARGPRPRAATAPWAAGRSRHRMQRLRRVGSSRSGAADHQHQRGVRRRLLQRLEEGILGCGIHRLGRQHQHHLARRLERAEGEPFLEAPHLLHPDVARRHVVKSLRRPAGGGPLLLRHHPEHVRVGEAGHPRAAAHRPQPSPGACGQTRACARPTAASSLAHARWPGEEPRVGEVPCAGWLRTHRLHGACPWTSEASLDEHPHMLGPAAAVNLDAPSPRPASCRRAWFSNCSRAMGCSPPARGAGLARRPPRAER